MAQRLEITLVKYCFSAPDNSRSWLRAVAELISQCTERVTAFETKSLRQQQGQSWAELLVYVEGIVPVEDFHMSAPLRCFGIPGILAARKPAPQYWYRGTDEKGTQTHHGAAHRSKCLKLLSCITPLPFEWRPCLHWTFSAMNEQQIKKKRNSQTSSDILINDWQEEIVAYQAEIKWNLTRPDDPNCTKMLSAHASWRGQTGE